MSARVDQFCDKLRDRLNAIEAWAKSAQADAKDKAGHAEKVLLAKLEDARIKMQSTKEFAEKTRANLMARAQQKIAETKEAIAEWKAKHDAQKLNARADRAEAYAADAIFMAVASIDEAEVAILDALVARNDADKAK